MRVWPVACALCVAACGDPPGLTLEVIGTDQIQRVELLVGRACEGSCPGGVGPPQLRRVEASLFVVDDPEVWTAQADHGAAGFRISSDVATVVPIIVAVGFDAQGGAVATAKLTDVAVPAGEAVYGRLFLESAGPLVDRAPGAPAPADGVVRVKHWVAGDTGKPSCVVLEHWNGGAAERIALGPSADTDCDQVGAPECAPWVYRAEGTRATIDQANCIYDLDLNGTPVCAAGGPRCNEVTGSGTACEPLDSDSCLAALLCKCLAWDVDCITQTLAGQTDNALQVTCVIPLDSSGAPCVDTPIADVDLHAILGGSPTRCTSVGLHELANPIGPFGTSVQIGQGDLSIERFAQPCTVDLRWQGQGPTTSTREVVLATLDLDNTRHLVVPVAIRFAVDGCSGAGPSCTTTTLSPTLEPMTKCAQPAPPPGMCEGTGACAGVGPLCGINCCRVGEQCVGGQCVCGTLPGCTASPMSVCSMGTAPCGVACCGGPSEPLCDF